MTSSEKVNNCKDETVELTNHEERAPCKLCKERALLSPWSLLRMFVFSVHLLFSIYYELINCRDPDCQAYDKHTSPSLTCSGSNTHTLMVKPTLK